MEDETIETSRAIVGERTAEIHELIRSETNAGGLTVIVSERQHMTQAKNVVVCEVCVTTIRPDGSRTTSCTPVPCPKTPAPKAPPSGPLQA